MFRILAAFTLFTRLPFWRLTEIPAEAFKHVVCCWPLVGWLTAGLSAAVFYASALVLPSGVALLLAITTRLLLTGGLHEDGLADFFDGMGGGKSREQILAIMKDSHIGTYGVISLILYFGFFYALLEHLPPAVAGSALLAGDPFSKGVAGMLVNRLPYARKAEEAKNKTLYNRMTAGEYMICVLSALLPLLWLPEAVYLSATLFPLFTFCLLAAWMRKRLQGYTGDCCGATFLLCELSFYMGVGIVCKVMG